MAGTGPTPGSLAVHTEPGAVVYFYDAGTTGSISGGRGPIPRSAFDGQYSQGIGAGTAHPDGYGIVADQNGEVEVNLTWTPYAALAVAYGPGGRCGVAVVLNFTPAPVECPLTMRGSPGIRQRFGQLGVQFVRLR